MPFLFVDYDQGAGGEFFCEQLSQSKQCVKLTSKKYKFGRTKVFDRFDQEFLKPNAPQPKFLSAADELYDIVPTHRLCELAKKLLGKIRTIRIAAPNIEDNMWRFLKYQQRHKVFLSKLSPELFLGEIKMLARTATNTNFLKQVHSKMDSLEINLLSMGVSNTNENREYFISNALSLESEPTFDYDLIIPYSDLFFNVGKVKQDILNTFGIEITEPWLDTYRKNYEAWLSHSQT
jgi:hypothetical protein